MLHYALLTSICQRRKCIDSHSHEVKTSKSNLFYGVYARSHLTLYQKITKVLPNRFDLMFEDQTTSDGHYVAVFALYPSSNLFGTVCFALYWLEDETW